MADDVPLAFYQPAGLFLKPDSKIAIQVRLPEIRGSGVSISNWEVMEKIKSLSKPEEFRSLRVENYSREVIRFEGEFETVRSMRKVVLLLNGKCMKLSGLSDLLKIRAKQHEPQYPTKKEWEDYFVEKGVETFDDGRPGERPDTLMVRGLPVKWFVSQTSENKPCPRLLTLAFQKFGNVRQVGICNPSSSMRHHHSEFSSFGPGSSENTLYFTAYIQYEKYSAFCSAMDTLKGMKLMRLECGGKEAVVSIEVNFDRSGYLSKKNILKRQRMEEQRQRELEEQRLKEEERKKERERKRRLEREAEEEARAAKKMKKLEEKRQKKQQQAMLVAQLKAIAVKRREEAQRLLSVLLAGAAEARWDVV